jgi:hypothetical protein
MREIVQRLKHGQQLSSARSCSRDEGKRKPNTRFSWVLHPLDPTGPLDQPPQRVGIEE